MVVTGMRRYTVCMDQHLIKPNDAGLWTGSLPAVVGIGLALGLLGAFGTHAALGVAGSVAYWLAVVFTGWLLLYPARQFAHWLAPDRPIAARATTLTTVTLVLWFALVGSHYAIGGELSLVEGLSVLAGIALVATVACLVLSLWARAQDRQSQLSAAETNLYPARAKLLQRLSLPYRSGELWSVHAEDHYLRVCTSVGETLIYCAFQEALIDLEGELGLKVHRSHWIAIDGVAKIRRRDGQYQIELKNGRQVPVARSHAAELRSAGWL